MAEDAKDKQQQGPQAVPEASFAHFVATLQLQAVVALGDVANPATGKQEKDLVQAKYLIDVLSVIEDKTKGNLDQAEEKLMQRIMYDLKMRYVRAVAGP